MHKVKKTCGENIMNDEARIEHVVRGTYFQVSVSYITTTNLLWLDSISLVLVHIYNTSYLL